MTTVAGFVCLILALGLMAAARARYTIQTASERGPLGRSVVFAMLGVVFGVAAALFFDAGG